VLYRTVSYAIQYISRQCAAPPHCPFVRSFRQPLACPRFTAHISSNRPRQYDAKGLSFSFSSTRTRAVPRAFESTPHSSSRTQHAASSSVEGTCCELQRVGDAPRRSPYEDATRSALHPTHRIAHPSHHVVVRLHLGDEGRGGDHRRGDRRRVEHRLLRDGRRVDNARLE